MPAFAGTRRARRPASSSNRRPVPHHGATSFRADWRLLRPAEARPSSPGWLCGGSFCTLPPSSPVFACAKPCRFVRRRSCGRERRSSPSRFEGSCAPSVVVHGSPQNAHRPTGASTHFAPREGVRPCRLVHPKLSWTMDETCAFLACRPASDGHPRVSTAGPFELEVAQVESRDPVAEVVPAEGFVELDSLRAVIRHGLRWLHRHARL